MQGGPPCLDIELQRKWAGSISLIELYSQFLMLISTLFESTARGDWRLLKQWVEVSSFYYVILYHNWVNFNLSYLGDHYNQVPQI